MSLLGHVRRVFTLGELGAGKEDVGGIVTPPMGRFLRRVAPANPVCPFLGKGEWETWKCAPGSKCVV